MPSPPRAAEDPGSGPEGSRGADGGAAAEREEVGAEAIPAGKPFRRRSGRRQSLEVGRAQRLEEGRLRHHPLGAASGAA